MLELSLRAGEQPRIDAARGWRVVVTDKGGAPYAYGRRREPSEYWLHVVDVGTFGFGPGSGQVVASPAPGCDDGAFRDAYHRTVLPIALHVVGFEALHASAVLVEPHGVVAFSGATEVGKSTIAFGLAQRGYDLWADDAVVFELPADRKVRTFRIPFGISLRGHSATYFGFEGAWRAPVDGSPGEGSPAPRPLACIVVLERLPDIDSAAELTEIARSDALAALLPQAWRFSLDEVDRKREMVRNYLELTARIPVLKLRFRSGLEGLSPLLDRLDERFTSL